MSSRENHESVVGYSVTRKPTETLSSVYAANAYS